MELAIDQTSLRNRNDARSMQHARGMSNLRRTELECDCPRGDCYSRIDRGRIRLSAQLGGVLDHLQGNTPAPG